MQLLTGLDTPVFNGYGGAFFANWLPAVVWFLDGYDF